VESDSTDFITTMMLAADGGTWPTSASSYGMRYGFIVVHLPCTQRPIDRCHSVHGFTLFSNRSTNASVICNTIYRLLTSGSNRPQLSVCAISTYQCRLNPVTACWRLACTVLVQSSFLKATSWRATIKTFTSIYLHFGDFNIGLCEC